MGILHHCISVGDARRRDMCPGPMANTSVLLHATVHYYVKLYATARSR